VQENIFQVGITYAAAKALQGVSQGAPPMARNDGDRNGRSFRRRRCRLRRWRCRLGDHRRRRWWCGHRRLRQSGTRLRRLGRGGFGGLLGRRRGLRPTTCCCPQGLRRWRRSAFGGCGRWWGRRRGFLLRGRGPFTARTAGWWTAHPESWLRLHLTTAQVLIRLRLARGSGLWPRRLWRPESVSRPFSRRSL